MDDARLHGIFDEGEDAWIVGGAVRDLLLGRRVVDVDVACAIRARRRTGSRSGREARRSLSPSGTAPGASRPRGPTRRSTSRRCRTGSRPISRRATSRSTRSRFRCAGGDAVDPHGGRADLEARVLRAVSDTIFRDDPLRLLRAVRIEEELGLPDGRAHGGAPARRRAARDRARRRADPRRASACRAGGIPAARRARAAGAARRVARRAVRGARLCRSSGSVAVFGERLSRLPISNDLAPVRGDAASCPPAGGRDAAGDPSFPQGDRAVGARRARVRGRARSCRSSSRPRALADPPEPLVRGDELGLPPGPAIGRILARIDEERAAGTISTREQALALARTLACAEASR